MNLFTRITATLGATAESAVSRFENHDAIAESALIEARQAVAKSRIRHQRLTRSIDDIRSQLDACEKQAQQWTRRAQKLAGSDEDRAMQCLEQRQVCRTQISNHKRNLSKHESLAAGMANRLNHMEIRLQGMLNQRNEMQSRESLARATQVMDRIDNQSSDGVDALFERWELSISDTEIRNDVLHEQLPTPPSLQNELEAEERRDTLQAELAALMVDSKEKSHD